MNDIFFIDEALTPNTKAVFEKVSMLECISDMYLCGGTAISLQIGNRKSEDLDFELLNTENKLDITRIQDELSKKISNCVKEILSESHVQFYVDGNVKLSFFKPMGIKVPNLRAEKKYGNIKVPSPQTMLGMKLFTIVIRSTFRDFYDIYSLLQKGCSLKEGILFVGQMTNHRIHSKQVISNLLTLGMTDKPKNFDETLEPKYIVNEEYLKQFFKRAIIEMQKNKLEDNKIENKPIAPKIRFKL